MLEKKNVQFTKLDAKKAKVNKRNLKDGKLFDTERLQKRGTDQRNH